MIVDDQDEGTVLFRELTPPQFEKASNYCRNNGLSYEYQPDAPTFVLARQMGVAQTEELVEALTNGG